ncbi:MAG: flippase [Synergistaceae bacterium]|nr:flippase [Synergistaceae bacterium]
MAKSIKRNYIYNTTYNILLVLTPLITAPYTSRIFHADGVGIISFVASVAEYFILFSNMGSGGYGQREISYVRDDIEKRSIVFWEVLIFRVINTAIALAVYVIIALFFVKSHRAVFLIYAITIANIACDVTWFLAGLEEFGKIVFRNIIIKIIDITFLFTFIRKQSDIPLYVGAHVFFIMMGNVALWGHLKGYIVKPNIKSLHPYRNIKTIISLFMPSIATQVYTVLDKIMLGIFTEGTFENGYYEQSIKLSKMTLALVTSLAGVMIPRIAYLFGQNDREQISFYMYRSYSFVWLISVPLCLGLIGISDNFVPWFFGPGYEKVAGLLKISSFLIIIIGFDSATGVQYLIPTKRQHLFTYSVAIGAAINFPLNLIFIRMYQSYGAMFASVIAEIAVTSVQFYIVRKEISSYRVIISGINYYISGGIMLAVLIFLNSKLTPSPIHTAIMIFTGAAVYVSSLFILRDKFFLEYSAKPFEFIRRKFAQRK